jgi:aminoglycoside phosphotransferase family enzyme/predicted kinase
MKQSPCLTSDFPRLLDALAQPGAFPFELSANEPIKIIQTHASAVLLVADRVYKLKKPNNFGFFDYSTPDLRRHFCGQEVLVNRRLASHVYLGVSPVLATADGRVRFGSTASPTKVAMPGAVIKGATVVDYAVVMVRLPDEATLEARVRAGTATADLLADVARFVAHFHVTAPSSDHIADFGSLEVIRGNWEENFAQMRPYIGRTLDVATYKRIAGYIQQFLDKRKALFASRVRDRYIRDCHGDLRLEHVYLLDTPGEARAQAHKIVILDGIEFNERFRYSDTAGDVAFLAMELDAAQRPDLSRVLIESYGAAAKDDGLRELLPFYQCYRACVRGKVASFQLDEPEIPAKQREAAQAKAAALFRLAASYTDRPVGPTLLLIGGLMGTGKSTLAQALQRELGWSLFSSDNIRKRLARLNPAQPRAEAFGQGVYSPAWTTRTYETLLNEAGKVLADGRSLLLDASFLRRTDRLAAARLAREYGARAMIVECVCPRVVALQRLEQRWNARVGGSTQDVSIASLASDARPALYDEQAARWEAIEPDKEAGIELLVVDTTRLFPATIEQVRTALHLREKTSDSAQR